MTMMNQINPDLLALENLLSECLKPDNVVIQQATSKLKSKFFKRQDSSVFLLEIVRFSQRPEVRQMAAVFMRKYAIKHWDKLACETRALLQQTLLERLRIEPERLVRHSISRVVSAIVTENPDSLSEWKDLPNFLALSSQSSNPIEREVAIELLSDMAESDADHIVPHLVQMLPVYTAALSDPASVTIRLTAWRILGFLADHLSEPEQQKMFRSAIPTALDMIQQLAKQGDYENAIKCVSVFDDLVECEVPLLSRDLGLICQAFLRWATDREHSNNFRVQCLDFIAWVAEYKHKALVKNDFLASLIEAIFHICAESDPSSEPGANDSESDDDDDERSPVRVASVVMDTLAMNLPPEKLCPQVLQLVSQGIAHSWPGYRRGSMVILTSMVEGCSEYLNKQVPALMSLLQRTLQDPDRSVRQEAFFALSEMSQFLQPDICQYHEEVVPFILSTIQALRQASAAGQPDDKSLEAVVFALDCFCENLTHEQIAPTLEAIMRTLLDILSNCDPKLQQVALSAVGAAATASATAFAPYLPTAVQALLHFLSPAVVQAAASSTKPESVTAVTDATELLALAADIVGQIASAVGVDLFRAFLPEFASRGLDCLDAIDDSRARSGVYYMFIAFAKLLGAESGAFLPRLMPHVFLSCERDDGFFAALMKERRGASSDTDEDEDDPAAESESATVTGSSSSSDDATPSLNVATGYVEEKESACLVLGVYFEHAPTAFQPHFKRAMEVISVLIFYFNDDVRESSVTSVGCFLRGAAEGHAPAEAMPDLIKTLSSSLISVMADDDNRSVVMQVCQELSDSLPAVHKHGLLGHLPLVELASAVLAILQKKAPCRRLGTDEANEGKPDGEEMDEDELAELDASLIEATCELIIGMTKVLGAQFLGVVSKYWPLIRKYAARSCSGDERAMAIGTFAGIIHGLGSAAAPFADEGAGAFVRGLADEDEKIRRNACYGVGVLAEAMGPDYATRFIEVLPTLMELTKSSSETVSDNACGAIARLFATCPDSIDGLPHIVAIWLSALPLRVDFEENTAVYSAILALLQRKTDLMIKCVPEMLRIFSSDLVDATKRLTPETAISIRSILSTLSSQFRDTFAAALAGLTAEQQRVLMSQE